MKTFKESKWALSILNLQKSDGSWGYFHTLSNPSSQNPLTTEQALRRLEILGFTIEDAPIQKAVSYMQDCLTGKNAIPDRREKIHNWDIFTDLMLSTWIHRFTKSFEKALITGEKWKHIITQAFRNGIYDPKLYAETYKEIHQLPPKGGRLIDTANFYHVSLLSGFLDKSTAQLFVEYVLQHEKGIYYIYDRQLSVTPAIFQSKETVRYLSAIELLSAYKNSGCRKKLAFMSEWINNNKNNEGRWDLSAKSKDGIWFPLCDSWRNAENRIQDCTYRINNLLQNLL